MSIKRDINLKSLNDAIVENAFENLNLNIQKQIKLLKKKIDEWKKLKSSAGISSIRRSSRTLVKRSSLGTTQRLDKADKLKKEILNYINNFKDFMKLEIFLLTMVLRDSKGKVIPLKSNLKKYISNSGELDLHSNNVTTINLIKNNPEFNKIYFIHIEKLDYFKSLLENENRFGVESSYQAMTEALEEMEGNVTMKNSNIQNNSRISTNNSNNSININTKPKKRKLK